MFEIALLGFIAPIVIIILQLCFRKANANSWFFLVLLFLIRLLWVYLFMPSRNLLSYLGANILYGTVYYVFTALVAYIFTCDYYHHREYDGIADYFESNKSDIAVIIGLVILLVIYLGGSINTWCDVKPTYDSIDKVTTTYKHAPTFKRNETPVALTPKTVHNRTNKSISDVPNSQFFKIADTDDIQAQFIDGKPTYLIPVEYQGFFAYLRSDRKIPGYFKISATDEAATPVFVKCSMKYSNTSYFGHNAEREIYRHYPDYVTSSSNPQLQISPNGTPYWIETLYRPELLNRRPDYHNMKIALLNAKTGETHLYTAKTLPEFVNEGITSDVANDMNNVFGKDVHGFWNQIFGKVGMISPTENGSENGVTSVFNTDGTISYFADFTNINSDNDSGVGYTMINARTGKLTFYQVDGMMDSDGAKNNADENYKAQKWHASMPIIYNISGRPAWVMQILDSTNAVRGYYYLDAKNQTIHANSDNVTDTLDQFNQALSANNISAGNTKGVSAKSISGVIDRCAVVSSSHKVMFMLQNNKTIFTVDTQDIPNAVLMKPGDQVTFKANVANGQQNANVTQLSDKQL